MINDNGSYPIACLNIQDMEQFNLEKNKWKVIGAIGWDVDSDGEVDIDILRDHLKMKDLHSLIIFDSSLQLE